MPVVRPDLPNDGVPPEAPDTFPGLTPTPGFQTQLPPLIADASHRDNVVDNNIVPHQAILSHIEGSPWTGIWMSQILGQDSEPMPPQVGGSNTVHQQYRRINNMEVRLQGSLTPSYEGSTGEFTITGEIITYPYFVPTQWDLWLADSGDGNLGVFIVGEPQPRSWFKEKVFSTTVTLVGTIEQQQFREYVEEHIVEDTYYMLDYLQLGRNPLMSTEAYNLKTDLTRLRTEVLSRFIEEFYSHEYRALLLKHQDRMVYDPLLQKALTSLTNRNEHPYIPRMIDRPTDECYELKIPTIWDLVSRNQQELYYTITKKMWVLPRSSFSGYVFNHGLRYSRLDFIVYPDQTSPFQCGAGGGQPFYRPELYDLQLLYNHFVLNGLGDVTPWNGTVPPTTPTITPPLIRPVNVDEYYVLSKAFYENIEGSKSLLEIAVLAMLEHQRFDFTIIKTLGKATLSWQPLDRYYYSLIIVALCNYAIKNL